MTRGGGKAARTPCRHCGRPLEWQGKGVPGWVHMEDGRPVLPGDLDLVLECLLRRGRASRRSTGQVPGPLPVEEGLLRVRERKGRGWL